MKTPNIFHYPLFALGFRPFFALAGLSALLLMFLWKIIYSGGLASANYFPPNYWHAHEMLLGYTVAVIAGFLLTAVGNWTGRPTLSGGKLAGLCLLWLYGRILPFYAGLLPGFVIAITDLAFLPFLVYFISKPIIANKQYRNLVFSGLLLFLFFGNCLIHSEMLGIKEHAAWFGLQVIVDTIIILTLVMAGRVFPFFTERGLPGTLAIRNPQLDIAAIISAVLLFILQLSGVSGTLLAIVALLAGLLNTARVAGWYLQKIWYVPLLWILYVGYGWIILGFVLTALSAFSLVQPSLALHAFTLGGIGVLTMGMMGRVALGHTGRKLQASNTLVVAFVLINVAAFFRILLPIILPGWFGILINASIIVWLAAFLFFIFEYGPILISERADGKEG
jgi:uncharacterized protein involved in response to NO